jgi:hypothetical protein
MALPKLIRDTVRTQQLAERAIESASVASARVDPDIGRRLPFLIERQELENWCWASVGLALARFHAAPFIPASQCQLASRVLGVAGGCCPPDQAPAVCDSMRSFDDVLHVIGLPFDAANAFEGPVDFSTITFLVNQRRPVVVQLRWSSGLGHVVVIFGYKQVTDESGTRNWVWVRDPLLEGSGQRVLWQGQDGQLRDELGALFGSWIYTFYPEPTH